jgi:riboflavin synthase
VTFRAPEGPGPVHRAERLGGAERHLADGERGRGRDFGINFIPHTREVTTWGEVAVGDAVNLEVDTMARYVARLREMGLRGACGRPRGFHDPRTSICAKSTI